MSFELVAAEEAHDPKALMCRALGLSRSGHHAFRTRGPSRRALKQQQLDVQVAAIFGELKGNYGAPRIEQELRRREHCTSKKRVAASMVRQGLAARRKRRWRTTTDSRHGEPIAPNLLKRKFSASAPNRVWVGDTTYLPVIGGFLFLVAITDLFSRKVVGWALGDRLDAELSCEALRRALARRNPPRGLIFHPPRGAGRCQSFPERRA
jgi:transposase InsO family protein